MRTSPQFFWIIVISIGSVLFAACAPAAPLAEAPGSTQAPPADEPDPPGATESTSLLERAAVTKLPPPPPVRAPDEIQLSAGDERPAGLRGVTSGWNTNWEQWVVSPAELLHGGPPRDGIPPIDNPKFIGVDEADEWLADVEPVIFFQVGDDARAYPLQILTWHEIVNDEVGELPVSVTFCPLCNAAIVFDRRLGDMLLDFGVSGLLRKSDLVMWDRQTETLWQQLDGQAIIGDLAGQRLGFLPSMLISWADFRDSFPEGQVLSRETGHVRSYGRNPYVGYDRIDQNPFLFRGELDDRLPPMERVVTVELAEDVAYPYQLLEQMRVLHDQVGEQELVIFFKPGTASALDAGSIADSRDVGSANVFDPVVDGQRLTFRAEGDDFVDEETGSTWNILGLAVDGPLAGAQLTPIIHANHFWFAWGAFKPETRVVTLETIE